MSDYNGEAVSVTRVSVPNIVIDGFDVIVPEAPLGEFAVALHSKLLVSRMVKVPFVGVTADRQLTTFGGTYMGHSVKEPTDAAGASVELYDGTGVSGQLFLPLTLVANESTRDWYPLPGIPIDSGIFLHVINGEVSGCIYLGVADRDRDHE